MYIIIILIVDYIKFLGNEYMRETINKTKAKQYKDYINSK